MKEELIKFMESQEVLGYRLDGGSEQIVRDCINEFFDQYQPERSKREDLVYRQPDFERMKIEYPSLYAKYEAAKKILECGALNIVETQ